MIQIEMSKDINDFSPKIISIFDRRQLICVGLACSYGLPIIMSKSFDTGFETRLTIGLLLMFPVIACGWVKLFGMPLERFVWHIIKTRVLGTPQRFYKTDNIYGFIDPTKPSGRQPARDEPITRDKNARKKYKQDMEKFEAKI